LESVSGDGDFLHFIALRSENVPLFLANEHEHSRRNITEKLKKALAYSSNHNPVPRFDSLPQAPARKRIHAEAIFI